MATRWDPKKIRKPPTGVQPESPNKDFKS